MLIIIILGYKDLADHFYSGAKELKSWKKTQENYAGKNSRFFVAVTKIKGEEKVVGCIGIKLAGSYYKNIPDNTYEILVSIYFYIILYTLLLSYNSFIL